MVKVTSERLPDAQVVLHIEVEPEAVERATQRAYQRLVNRLNVPGFRKGKAPRYLVERMIGGADALRQEGLERLIPEVYREALRTTGVEPIDQPEFDVLSADPLVVKATVSVQPGVQLGDYKSIRVPRLPVEVPYERINEAIERLREQQTRWEPVERSARAGDHVTADVEGTIGVAPTLFDPSGQPLLTTGGGEQLIEQKNAEVEIDPASKVPVPGFHTELVGVMPKSEKRFVLSLPDDWPDEAQRGHSVMFHVVVHEVKEPKVPALDDEFAKAVGDYETFDALRDNVRDRLRDALEHDALQQYQETVIAEAVGQSTVSMPPTLIRRETDRLVRNFEQNLARQRLSLDQYLKLTDKTREALADDLRPDAERNLRNYLVLREISLAESVVVTDEEIEAQIERMVALAPDEAEAVRVRELLGRGQDKDDIRASLWEQKVTRFMVDLAQQAPVEGTKAVEGSVPLDEAEPVEGGAPRDEAGPVESDTLVDEAPPVEDAAAVEAAGPLGDVAPVEETEPTDGTPNEQHAEHANETAVRPKRARARKA